MNIRPLQDRVVLKRDDPQQRSPGGILIPATAGEKPTEGRVVAVGQGKVLANGKVRPTDLKAGDRVLFGKYSGTEVKLNGEELIVAREEDIMAVVEEA
ncbi:MAG: co-chaperone GroES [Gammaproteobacteria bacterium]|nr:MAG: co-chaperone GroES [Gammaproteobacteria bacterium]TLZ01982.1 MAG: co-chaperone GroES [Gammaproteobacteria bacterium]TLZ42965.1 MAG: co-chaperone GroES [Gammaproteobacteria bacterium]